MLFALPKSIEIILYGHVRKSEALTFLLDKIYIRFDTKQFT